MLAVPACHGRSPTATITAAAISHSPLWASTQVRALLGSPLWGFLASRGEGILGGMSVVGCGSRWNPKLGKVRKMVSSAHQGPCRFGIFAIWESWGWGWGWGKSELTFLHRQLVDWVCVIGWINVDLIGGLDALTIDDAGLRHHHHRHIVMISARNCCYLLALCTWWVK